MTAGVKPQSRDGWPSRAGSVVATSDPAPHRRGFVIYTKLQTDNREHSVGMRGDPGPLALRVPLLAMTPPP